MSQHAVELALGLDIDSNERDQLKRVLAR